MWTDVVDLRDFYGGGLGRVARRMIGRQVRELWPDVTGQRVLGMGYATPFLGPFRAEAERVLAVMPAPQGVLHWPSEGGGLTALADETLLPFPDRSMDRILVAHVLECAEQTRPLMRELWRVLADGGRLLIIVPNRRGLWARFERTPFGRGRPYSLSQVSWTLREAVFTPYQIKMALFIPPIGWRMILSAAAAWEEVGQRWFVRFGGVVMVEATKQIYAGQPLKLPARAEAYAPILPR